MYRILLVEDEPPALRYLRNIIDYKLQDFEVVGEAEDGQRALEIIELLKPDIVISDIRMPIMDGIALVTEIKDRFPEIITIISSGYQDFEYAKGALKAGVVEYLLKPVKPSQLQVILNTLKNDLDNKYYEKQVHLFNSLLRDEEPKELELKKYLSCSTYNMAIIRKNGLPSRYKLDNLNNDDSLASKPQEEIWFLRGRDEYEVICIAERTIEKPVLEQAKQWEKDGYYTALVYSKRVKLEAFKQTFKELVQALQVSTIIGKNQVLRVPLSPESSAEYPLILEDTLVKKINFLVSNCIIEDLQKEIIKIFEVWERKQYTLLQVENNIRQLLHIIKKHSNSPKEISYDYIETFLDEAICHAATMGELMENIWYIMEMLLKINEGSRNKLIKEEFLESIESYLVKNLAEPISLQQVCNYLGISQTYLSRLFRKYKNISFNEYVTSLRINEAKRLMNENPKLLLKDIAEMVGYTDAAYFSRVFRSLTGISPSRYNNAE